VATLLVQSGGSIAAAQNVIIGDQADSSGVINITGETGSPPTQWNLMFGGTLIVGNGGSGTLDITQGGTAAVISGGAGTIDVGVTAGTMEAPAGQAR
jgi:T5SS/PEP-CTERM-associated repeat protein